MVVATLPDGTTSSQTITVISSQPAPFDISVEPQAGIAPLKAAFRIESRQAQPISQVEADFDGDGVVDLAVTNPAVPPEFTYTRPGVYPARITVTDAQGAMTTATLYVVVYDPLERDQFFGTLWNGMNDALKRGDANAALNYLNANAKTKFQSVFELLLPQMNTIIASYSPPQRLSVSESIGEYAITRPYQGRTRAYLIYYLQDADGVWRLDEM
jgi:PKD repeat protein